MILLLKKLDYMVEDLIKREDKIKEQLLEKDLLDEATSFVEKKRSLAASNLGITKKTLLETINLIPNVNLDEKKNENINFKVSEKIQKYKKKCKK